MAGRRGPNNECYETVDDESIFIVIHPACNRPILLLDLWATRIDSSGRHAIRCEGICHHCDRYVRLQYVSHVRSLKAV